MAIERQTPDPAQEVEDMQDMTTERSTEDIDNEIIEILEGLDEEGVQVSRRWLSYFGRDGRRNGRRWF